MLSLKLSEGNEQVLKGIIHSTGEVFYIDVKRPSKHTTQLLIHGPKSEIHFGRVSKDDLLHDGAGNIVADKKQSAFNR